MKRMNLTKTLCDKAAVPEGKKKVVLWDAAVPGLALVVTVGSKTWYYVPRTGDRQKWIGIGAYYGIKGDLEAKLGVWTVEAARDEAARMARIHDLGGDVKATVARERKRNTMADLLADYMGTVAWKELSPRTRSTYRGYVDNHLTPWIGDRMVRGLDFASVLELQENIASSQKPRIDVTAGLVVKLLAVVLDYAADLGWCGRDNPCRRVRKVAAKKRERVLTAREYGLLGESLDDGQNARILRLLAVSGMRVGEALALPKSAVDLEGRVLTIVDHKTKRKAGTKRLPINEAMADVLRGEMDYLGPWVWKGLKGEHRKYASLQNYFADVCERAGLAGVTIHDLRRSFATVGCELGYPPADMDVLIGHKLPGLQATYIHMGPEGILAEASEAVGAWITAALEGKMPRVGGHGALRAKARRA